MLRDRPGVFCAGEMLDWEAPTGGYLLTACFASGVVAGRGAARLAAAMRLTAGSRVGQWAAGPVRRISNSFGQCLPVTNRRSRAAS